MFNKWASQQQKKETQSFNCKCNGVFISFKPIVKQRIIYFRTIGKMIQIRISEVIYINFTTLSTLIKNGNTSKLHEGCFISLIPNVIEAMS